MTKLPYHRVEIGLYADAVVPSVAHELRMQGAVRST